MEIIDWPRGKLITEPGIYRGLPIEIYHGQPCDGPSISSSGLRKIFNESPAHYWVSSSLNPKRIEEAPNKFLTLGKAAHHLLLGEADFSTSFIVRPEEFPDWKTNASKAWRAEQEAAGRTVLTPEQIDTIRAMAHSLAGHPLVANGILAGDVETSLVWRDKETGIWLKARPDAIPTSSGDFADLKTASSVATEDLEKSIYSYGYAQQAALIAEGFEALTGRKAESFNLVFVETSAPFCCRVGALKGDDLARGAEANRSALRVFAHCLERGLWPGPGGYDAAPLGMTPWAVTQMEFWIDGIKREYLV
jgi:hypothetical protein